MIKHRLNWIFCTAQKIFLDISGGWSINLLVNFVVLSANYLTLKVLEL